MRRSVRRTSVGGSMLLVPAIVVSAVVGVAMSAGAVDRISGAATVTRTAERIAAPPIGPGDGPSAAPTIGGCRVFPADNPWNTRVDGMAVRSGSAATIAAIQSAGGGALHPDFGEDPSYGIPFVVVPADQPLVPIGFRDAGADESDPGPYPVPADAPVESGSDHHVLVLQQGSCRLYEMFEADRAGAGWTTSWGATFDLSSNALRPLGWTSADAAGLPILPGLVRYDEVAAGHVDHAIRVTFARTQRGYILPATHFASSRTDANLPPMGLRLRLRSDYDISALHGQAAVIATALQRYGFIVADNGSNWFFQGAPSPGWDDDDLSQLKSIPGDAFEAVDTGEVRPSAQPSVGRRHHARRVTHRIATLCAGCLISRSLTSTPSVVLAWSMSRRRSPLTAGPWPAAS